MKTLMVIVIHHNQLHKNDFSWAPYRPLPFLARVPPESLPIILQSGILLNWEVFSTTNYEAIDLASFKSGEPFLVRHRLSTTISQP